jgi:hypothetical protein
VEFKARRSSETNDQLRLTTSKNVSASYRYSLRSSKEGISNTIPSTNVTRTAEDEDTLRFARFLAFQ